eukprot:3786605-Rhodomonas_salina.1
MGILSWAKQPAPEYERSCMKMQVLSGACSEHTAPAQPCPTQLKVGFLCTKMCIKLLQQKCRQIDLDLHQTAFGAIS